MKSINRFVIGLAVYGATFSTAIAQESNDDGSAAAGVEAASALSSAEPVVERYLVTYMRSRTAGLRSATVVTVTNQANRSCEVKIDWFIGFTPDTPACTTTAALAPGVTHDFCSRSLSIDGITTCNTTCDPALIFTEGKAIVSSGPCNRIGVEARVYYTTGETSDTGVSAVSNPNIVRVDQGNRGD
jgi:hypothetical protein